MFGRTALEIASEGKLLKQVDLSKKPSDRNADGYSVGNTDDSRRGRGIGTGERRS